MLLNGGEAYKEFDIILFDVLDIGYLHVTVACFRYFLHITCKVCRYVCEVLVLIQSLDSGRKL